MMRKLLGVLIILCGCFLSAALGQETNFTLTALEQPVMKQTRVEVGIETNAQLVMQAHGTLLQGKVAIRLHEKVALLSGDYAGWGYAYGEYKVSNLKGSAFFVFHNDEWKGMLSGDIIGVARQSTGLQGDMTWQLAQVGGGSTQATVNLVFESHKPGKQTTAADVWMPVFQNVTLVTQVSSTGQYIGPYEQETTLLILPAPDGNAHNARKFKGGGLEFGTYQAGSESGSLWSFISNQGSVNPLNKDRFGTRDGVLAGTSEIIFSRDGNGLKKINGTAKHVAQY